MIEFEIYRNKGFYINFQKKGKEKKNTKLACSQKIHPKNLKFIKNIKSLKA